jgi:hypothetical protein
MIAANFAAEVAVLPNVVLMITSIVAPDGMTDPLIVLSVYVGSFGMALLIAIRLTTLVAARTTAAFVAALRLNLGTRTAATSVAMLYLSAAAVRRWAVSGYVTAANLRAAVGAAAGWVLPATSAATLDAFASLLGKCCKRQNQKNCKQTR